MNSGVSGGIPKRIVRKTRVGKQIMGQIAATFLNVFFFCWGVGDLKDMLKGDFCRWVYNCEIKSWLWLCEMFVPHHSNYYKTIWSERCGVLSDSCVHPSMLKKSISPQVPTRRCGCWSVHVHQLLDIPTQTNATALFGGMDGTPWSYADLSRECWSIYKFDLTQSHLFIWQFLRVIPHSTLVVECSHIVLEKRFSTEEVDKRHANFTTSCFIFDGFSKESVWFRNFVSEVKWNDKPFVSQNMVYVVGAIEVPRK